MKTIVFGQSGQVAESLKAYFPQARFVSQNEKVFESRARLVDFLNTNQPELILNPSAFTAVDKAEVQQSACEHLNHFIPAWIGEWSAQNATSVIHFSTDYVYSGAGSRPWIESDPMEPLNWYGETKRRGDVALLQSACHALILRTSWVYSLIGVNFVKTMLKLAHEKENLEIVSDQIGSPTSANDLAQVVFQLTQKPQFKMRSGIFHYSGSGFTSWVGFAQEIFRLATQQGQILKIKNIRPIFSQDYPSRAQRPLNSRLDCSKIKDSFGIELRPWQDSLKQVLTKI